MVMSIRLLSGLLVAVASAIMLSLSSATAQAKTCEDFTSPDTAQYAMELMPSSMAPSLDPDGNGIACDHETAANPESGQPGMSSGFDGKLGSSQAGFAAIYGEPIDSPTDLLGLFVTHVYAASVPSVDRITVLFENDMAHDIILEPVDSWETSEVQEVIQPFLPDDVHELPTPQPTAEGTSYLLRFHSATLETSDIEEYLEDALIAGETGDFHVLLHTEGGSSIVGISLSLGDGSEILPAGQVPDDSTSPAPTSPASTTQTTEPATTGVVTLGSSHAVFEATFGPPRDQLALTSESVQSTGYSYPPPPNAESLFIMVTEGIVEEIVLTPAERSWSLDETMAMLQPFLPADIAELPPLEQIDDTNFALSLHSPQLTTPEVEHFMSLVNLLGEPGDFWVSLETSLNGEHVFELRMGLGSLDGNTQAPFQGVVGALGMSQAQFESHHGTSIEQLPLGDWPEGSEIFLYPAPPSATDLQVVYYEGVLDQLFFTAESAWTFDGAMAVLQPYLPADLTELPSLEQIDETTFLLSLHTEEFVTPEQEAWLEEIYHGEPGDIYVRLHTHDGEMVYEIEYGIGNLGMALEQEALNDSGAVSTSEQGVSPEADAFLMATRDEVDVRLSELESFRAIVDAGTYTDAESLQMADIIVTWMEVDPSLPSAPAGFADMALQVQDLREEFGYLGTDLGFFLTDPQNTDLSEAAYTFERIESTLADLDQQLTALGY